MTFFPPDPPADDDSVFEPPQDPRWSPPQSELPRLFPISETLAVTDGAAIIVTCARVFRNGVEFVIERRMRRGSLTPREWQVAQWGLHGMYGPADPDRLRYGVALGNGEHVLLEHPPLGEDPAESRHTLAMTGGGGGGSGDYVRFEDGLWLCPLPPAGPLEIVAQWPAQGMDESRVVLDSAPLLDLATSVRSLWA